MRYFIHTSLFTNKAVIHIMHKPVFSMVSRQQNNLYTSYNFFYESITAAENNIDMAIKKGEAKASPL